MRGPWVQIAEIMWLAPQVIALPAARMVRGGWPPDARDRREYVRMVQEKVEGVVEIAAAVAASPPRAELLGRVVAPVHRRVRANHRRLSRR